MRKSTYFYGAILLLCSLVGIGLIVLPSIDRQLNRDIHTLLPRAYVGVLIQDAQSGRILYQRNAAKFFSPASNMKLFTAAAALYHLGPNYRYLTSLSKQDNDIYLTFSGSPSLTTDNLKQLIQYIQLNGIQAIKGNIILDHSRFKQPYYAAGVSYDDMGWFYEAPSNAIILNGNAEAYECLTAKELGSSIQLTPKKPNPILHLINEVKIASKEQAKTHCSLHLETRPNNTLRLYGCIAENKQPKLMQFAVPDPVAYAKQVIVKTLAEENITLLGDIREGMTPSSAVSLAVLQSPPLITLIAHMLQESDNLYADSITKTLGVVITGEGSYQQGIFAMKQILAKHTHLDVKQLEFADGMGSRYNYVTPKQLTQLLNEIYRNPTLYSLFSKALPLMGKSGTLKERMKKLENTKVLAKTGSMHDISSLSGYLMNDAKRTLIFTIISNNVSGGIQKAKNLEEKILLKFAH